MALRSAQRAAGNAQREWRHNHFDENENLASFCRATSSSVDQLRDQRGHFFFFFYIGFI
jgi:hypothetical protein